MCTCICKFVHLCVLNVHVYVPGTTVSQIERLSYLCHPHSFRGGHVTAKYKTLQLSLAGEQSEGGVLQALPSKGAETWTPVCSSEDPHCLSCALF